MTKSRYLTIAAIVLIGILISMWLMRSNPVLFVLMERGPLLPGHLVFIQNPFRDREPERVAENFLNNLKDNNLDKAFESLESSPEDLSVMLEKEAESRIVDWHINQRSGSINQASIEYWVNRGPIGEEDTYISPVWLELRKTQEIWRVTDYETHY